MHRDVKPSNVLLTAEGHAKLADFGLVRHLSEIEARCQSPAAGTPMFMAPELFGGAPASARSDLYAVGIMYYCLLAGRLPFASTAINDLIRLHREAPVPDIRAAAPAATDVEANILKRCLAKRPEERYATALELADDLETAIDHLRDTETLGARERPPSSIVSSREDTGCSASSSRCPATACKKCMWKGPAGSAASGC